MKLELKHLAPYLPYGLKILNGWGDIKTLNYTHLDDEGNGFIKHVKPFLRPMSDLTKEIEHNGEKYSVGNIIFPKDDYDDDFTRKCAIEALKLSNAIHHVNTPYSIVEVLFKNHFDVFGLIPAGLAIDINELNQTE